ncbi:DUF1232 domain-containing protein [Streptomyces sp. URMC 123]|uniref:DUF1232 domain-containing protein n=1 Tax=Streptomyces sp. URMC 123 TaxID=3423403 RepID=UPI003F1E2877
MSAGAQALVAGALLVLAATAVTAGVLFVRLVRARRALRRAGLPDGRAALWGAALYVLCPVDLLPDPVLLDDIGVLLLALRSVHAAAARAGRPAPALERPSVRCEPRGRVPG